MSTHLFSDTEISVPLSPEQEFIITRAEGPCLVLGGPGSGKTLVVIHRYAHLLKSGVPASSIMLLTCTPGAAVSTTRELIRLLGFVPAGLFCGSFYQMAVSLLRELGKSIDLVSSFTVLDQEEACLLLQSLIQAYSTTENFPSARTLREIIRRSVNTQEGLRQTVNLYYPQFSSYLSSLEGIYRDYLRIKRAQNLFDVEDLLLFWHRLTRREDAARYLETRFRYILVDDYQNTSKLENLILYQMSKKSRNLMVTADDAQSVFSFRGASMNNILEFPKFYPGARIFSLMMNYRSTPEIVSLAQGIIRNNRVQFPKKMVTRRKTGVKPAVVCCKNPHEEALFVTQRISQLIRTGVSPEEIGILFRFPGQSSQVKTELQRREIPYYLRGEESAAECSGVKNLLSYLRVLNNPEDRLAWAHLLSEEALNRIFATEAAGPTRGESSLQEIGYRLRQQPWPDSEKDRIEALVHVLQEIQQRKEIPEIIEAILDSRHFFLMNRACGEMFLAEEAVERIKEFSLSFHSLSDFLAAFSLKEELFAAAENSRGAVTLSSIHQACGQQWSVVFLIGLALPFFPQPAAITDINCLEEERRLFYIAVTRAREDLYLTYYLQSHRKKDISCVCLFVREVKGLDVEEWNYE